MQRVEVDVLLISCLFWLFVGWTMGRWRREEAERNKDKRRFKRMIRRR